MKAILSVVAVALAACSTTGISPLVDHGGGVGGDHGTTAAHSGAVHGANATRGGMGHSGSGAGGHGASSGAARR